MYPRCGGLLPRSELLFCVSACRLAGKALYVYLSVYNVACQPQADASMSGSQIGGIYSAEGILVCMLALLDISISFWGAMVKNECGSAMRLQQT